MTSPEMWLNLVIQIPVLVVFVYFVLELVKRADRIFTDLNKSLNSYTIEITKSLHALTNAICILVAVSDLPDETRDKIVKSLTRNDD